MSRIFFSYSHADKDAMAPLVVFLRAMGVDAWQDTSETGDFDPIQPWIVEGLEGSAALVAWCSKSYAALLFCQYCQRQPTAAWLAGGAEDKRPAVISTALVRLGEAPQHVTPTLGLHPGTASDDGRVPVSLDWRSEDATAVRIAGASVAPLDPVMRAELRWYFEEFPDHQLFDPPARERARRVERRMAGLGHALFRDLFECSDAARTLWATVRDRIGDIRIELAGTDDADAVPWEWLRETEDGVPLALAAREFVRVPYDPVQPAEAAGTTLDGPLRVLLVISRPAGPEDVPYRPVAARLFRSLKAGKAGAVRPSVLRPPTFGALQNVLEQAYRRGEPFHLVHFDGHGVFEGRGYLLFESATPGSAPVRKDGRTLGEVLCRDGVAGLVLNACRSAYAGAGDDASVSLAREVMEAGAGAVVAMRAVVLAETAALFVGEFYRRLALGDSFGVAASAAHRALYENSRRGGIGSGLTLQDWAVPAVFEAAPLSLPGNRHQAVASSGARVDDDGLPPEPSTGFIGRESTLLALDRAFDRHRIVLLHAGAGSGKTTTAVEFARWYRDSGGHDGPIWFESFQAHRPLTRVLDRIETAFAGALRDGGIDWTALDGAERRAVAFDLLRHVPVLWVWDNVEPVAGFPSGAVSHWAAEEQAELAEFLHRLTRTGSKVLLTSRRRETAWLGNLPARIEAPPMPMGECLAMAAELATRQGRNPETVLPHLGPLLEWSGGNPMTIGVVIRQALRHDPITPEEIAAHVEHLRAGEAALDGNPESGRAGSLGASLAYGFSAFDAGERQRIALLHLFQELVSVDTLVLMGDRNNPGQAPPYAGLGPADWGSLLERATDNGLLGDGEEPGTFTIHPALSWFLKDGFDAAFPPAVPPAAPVHAYVMTMGKQAISGPTVSLPRETGQHSRPCAPGKPICFTPAPWRSAPAGWRR